MEGSLGFALAELSIKKKNKDKSLTSVRIVKRNEGKRKKEANVKIIGKEEKWREKVICVYYF